MLASLSLATIGVIFLILFGVFHWLGIFTKLRSFLAFIAVCLLGFVGWLGHLLANLVTWGAHMSGSATGWAFGVGVPMGLFVILGAILIHDWHPKHGASKRTGWIAIAVAAMLVGGVSGISTLNGIPSTVRSVVSNAKTVGG
jgi:hypothetical protein